MALYLSRKENVKKKKWFNINLSALYCRENLLAQGGLQKQWMAFITTDGNRELI